MPTPTGAETINERLSRLRTDLVRVRASIARGENNGASSNIGGAGLTEIAYERLVERERKLGSDIAALEARLAGSAARPGIGVFVTCFTD
jgi:hypothetical protein